MKSKISVFLTIAVIVGMFMASCVKENNERVCEATPRTDCRIDSQYVHIKVRNFTGQPICGLLVDHGEDIKPGSFEFGHIEANDTTCFYAMIDGLVAQYPAVSATIGSTTFEVEKYYTTYTFVRQINPDSLQFEIRDTFITKSIDDPGLWEMHLSFQYDSTDIELQNPTLNRQLIQVN